MINWGHYKPISHHLSEKETCLEITKVAIHPDYAGKEIIKPLFLALFNYCEETEHSVIACTHNGYLKELFKEIDIPLKITSAFKDKTQGDNLVDFYFASYQNDEVSKSLECFENELIQNKTKIFKALEMIEPVLPTPFYWMDKNGTVLGINDLCLKAIGTTREIIGRKPFSFYKKEIADHILLHNPEVIERKEILSQEEWIEDVTTKEIKCFSSIKAPLYDDQGQVVGIVGSSVDITKEKKAEKELVEAKELAESAIVSEEQLRHAVTILAGSVAHDLRTPIASINLFTKLLTKEIGPSATETTKNLLLRLQNITDDMNQNIDSTLKTISQAVKGTIDKENLSEFNIDQCIKHVLENYPFHNDEKAIISSENNYSFNFKGNTIDFYRILFNLIKNSLYQIQKHGRGKIIITTESNDEFNLLKFKDTAGSITQKMIENIFSGFYTTKNSGTGIGLAFCQLAMQKIGGDIDCHIVDNDCIEFLLKFPKEN